MNGFEVIQLTLVGHMTVKHGRYSTYKFNSYYPVSCGRALRPKVVGSIPREHIY